MISLATIHSLAEGCQGRAETLAAQAQTTGQTLGAELVYETFFTTVGSLVLEGLSPLPAWGRTILTLCGRGEHPAVDALATSRLDLARVRLAAFADIPDISTLNLVDEIYRAIANAIEIGAARYNQGDLRGCAITYWAAMHTLVVAPTLQESAPFQRALEPLRATLRRLAGTERLDRQGADDFCWALRRAFDAALSAGG